MGNRDRSRPATWASLLVMASTASALTLSNFQLITSTGVPIACILVYNTILPGCSTDDFRQGTTCSSACANGIARVQDRIREVCDGVNVPAASVLGQVLMGNVVNLLCPAVGTPSSSTPPSRTPPDTPPDTPTASPSLIQSSPPQPPPPQTTEAQQTETQQTDAPAPTLDLTQGGGVTPDFIAQSSSRQLVAGLLQACFAALATGLLLIR